MNTTESVEDRVRRALHGVVDPEIGLDVVELGLVHRITAGKGRVEIDLMTTSPFCPFNEYIAEEARRTTRRLVPDAGEVVVNLVPEPSWQPSMMSEEARKVLGWE